ncbi:hypothetical protein NDU88_000513 [Pleurodeles waltl]|uniref:Uncharacterized protein n=1 Tax=Pleurodeles waltl TaxID=8319 RepID=A0AAV7KQ40_PLEWA|nr:hypothetical protein NDU88_000513 [Pleurodeles waltl]
MSGSQTLESPQLEDGYLGGGRDSPGEAFAGAQAVVLSVPPFPINRKEKGSPAQLPNGPERGTLKEGVGRRFSAPTLMLVSYRRRAPRRSVDGGGWTKGGGHSLSPCLDPRLSTALDSTFGVSLLHQFPKHGWWSTCLQFCMEPIQVKLQCKGLVQVIWCSLVVHSAM